MTCSLQWQYCQLPGHQRESGWQVPWLCLPFINVFCSHTHLSPAFSFLVPFLMSLESLAIRKSAPKKWGWAEKESLSLGLGGALNRPYNASMLVYKAGIIIPWVTGTQRSSGTCIRSHSKKVMSRDWDSSTSHSKTSPWSAESLLLTYVEYW